MAIHNTAIVDSGAGIGSNVTIGPFAIVESGAVIGSDTEVMSHAVIKCGARIGNGCRIHHGAVIGDLPQDTKFKGENTPLIIGDNCIVREYATLHRACGEGEETVIGNNCMLMVSTHVAHNCRVGNNVIMANIAALGGHVEVGDNVFVGGLAAVHQFVRIGSYSIIGGGSAITADVPPYMMAVDRSICAINTVGLQRAGFSPQTRSAVKKAFRALYRENRSLVSAMSYLRENFADMPEIAYLIEFLEKSKRGICPGR